MIESQVKEANLYSFGVVVTNQDETIFDKIYGKKIK